MGIVERYKERVKQRLRDYAIVEAYRKRRRMRLDDSMFIPMCYAVVKDAGIDTKGMSVEDVVDEYDLLRKQEKADKDHPQYSIKVSDKGKNVSPLGFSSPGREFEHFDNHRDENVFKNMTQQQYVDYAKKLCMKAVGGEIIGGKYRERDKDGRIYECVMRYNTKTGVLVMGRPGHCINTCMVAKYWKNDEEGRPIRDENGNKVFNPDYLKKGKKWVENILSEKKKNQPNW